VFYTQRVIKGLNTEAQLHEFLAASPSNVVVMAAEVEPGPPLKVLKVMQVGRQNYYFIGQ
ncbi:MAG: dolichyl-phosphate-mannose--protein mannosyltransferase, partial [Pseudomonas sp.]